MQNNWTDICHMWTTKQFDNFGFVFLINIIRVLWTGCALPFVSVLTSVAWSINLICFEEKKNWNPKTSQIEISWQLFSVRIFKLNFNIPVSFSKGCQSNQRWIPSTKSCTNSSCQTRPELPRKKSFWSVAPSPSPSSSSRSH